MENQTLTSFEIERTLCKWVKNTLLVYNLALWLGAVYKMMYKTIVGATREETLIC